MGGLRSAIAGVSPPQNSQTPMDRTDPQHIWLTRLQPVRQTLLDLNELLDDKDDATQSFFTAITTGVERMMKGFPANEVALMAAAQMIKPFSPDLAKMLEAKWAEINRPAQVAGPAIQTGVPGEGAPPQPPAAAPPGMGGPAPMSGPPMPGAQRPPLPSAVAI